MKVSQKGFNNDNPAFLYAYIKEKMAKMEYPFIRDETRESFIKFHQGHSASVFFPVLNNIDQIT